MSIPAVVPADLSLFEEGAFYVIRDDQAHAVYWSKSHATAKSLCEGDCSKLWPPVVPSANATDVGDWKIIKRSDGTRQWTYQGKPLHMYAKDISGAQAGGDGNGDWQMLKFSK